MTAEEDLIFTEQISWDAFQSSVYVSEENVSTLQCDWDNIHVLWNMLVNGPCTSINSLITIKVF